MSSKFFFWIKDEMHLHVTLEMLVLLLGCTDFLIHPRLINLNFPWWEAGLDAFTCKRWEYRKNLCFSFGLCPLCDALQWCVQGLCSFFCRSSEVACSRCTLTFLPLLTRSPVHGRKETHRMMGFLYAHLFKTLVQHIFHKWNEYERNLLIFFLFLTHNLINYRRKQGC